MAEQNQNIANEAVNIFIPDKLLLVARGKRSESLGPKMQKVPELLRIEKNNLQDYYPQMVSLGPYHHGEPQLQLAENFKLKTLEMFIADSGKDVPFFYNEVLQQVNDARNCYIEDSTHEFDDPTFAQMMLLDAVFIINFMMATPKSPKFKRNISAMLHHFGNIVFEMIGHDLYLLENQIPFSVLKLLICLGYGKERGEKTLNDFLSLDVLGEYERTRIASSEQGQDQPFHLLDAYWKIFVSACDKNSEPSPPPTLWSGCMRNDLCRNIRRCITKFPGLDWRKKDANEDIHEMDIHIVPKMHMHSFPSVTDLKARGIHFSLSSDYSLKGMKFKSGYFCAELDVPFWYVSMETKVIISNLIAYEMCPGTTTDQSVTAYIDFMKSLINSPKDAKELRENGILFTCLGSDEEVVNVFKEIKTYAPNNPGILQNVKKEIHAHYNNCAKTSLAELLHTHCSSPQTVIAWLAATFLLVLTFLQTYFTINPVSGK